MVEQRSTNTETADASRMEYLLGALRSLSQQDPPPALREHLGFSHTSDWADWCGDRWQPRAGLRSWLRPALVVALLPVIGFLAVLVVHISPV